MDVLKLWLPIDTNVKAEGYQIPTIENQRESLVALLNAEDEQEPEPEPEEPQSFYSHKKKADPMAKKVEKFFAGWIDVMSFSHNVANGGSRRRGSGDQHVGELTLTKFTCDRAPTLNYLTLRGETIPHAVFRLCLKSKGRTIGFIEYELQYVKITNVSISGGSGGKPVETLSLGCKQLTIKNVSINLDSGEFEIYQVATWDTVKNAGSKTIYSNSSVVGTGTKSLLELAKKRLMVDLDSQDPQTVALIKELGIITDYELPDKKDDEVIEETEIYRVLIKKEPQLYSLIDIDSKNLTIDSVKKSISEKVNIPVDTIKNLYNIDNGILLGTDPRILKITTSFLVETTDGKFLGY